MFLNVSMHFALTATPDAILLNRNAYTQAKNKKNQESVGEAENMCDWLEKVEVLKGRYQSLETSARYAFVGKRSLGTSGQHLANILNTGQIERDIEKSKRKEAGNSMDMFMAWRKEGETGGEEVTC